MWALPWLWVPGEMVMAALLVATLAAGWRSAREHGPVGLLAGVLAFGTVSFVVIDTLVLERQALRVRHRVDTPSSPPEQLRLLDLNVLHGYDRFPRQEERAARTVAAVAALRPDVIVLQEAWRTRRHGDFVERLAAEMAMDSAFARANGRLERIGFEEGEAILSRYPILHALRLSLEPRKPFFERRIALVCVLDLGGDETLTVVGTHLDHRRAAVAEGQARHLAAKIASLRSPVVAGDFNAGSDSEALRVFLGLGYRDVVPGGIDHVLLPPTLAWDVASAEWTLRPAPEEERDATWAISDHPGLIVDLTRAAAGVAASEDVR